MEKKHSNIPLVEVPLHEYNALLAELESVQQKLTLSEVHLADAREKLQHKQNEMDIVSDSMRIMLDTMPLAAQIWSLGTSMIYANQAAARLFGFQTVQEFTDNFWDTVPKYQPTGEKSVDMGKRYTEEAFEKGYLQTHWIQLNTKGEAIPLDVTFVSSLVHGKSVLFVFLEDQREKNDIINKLHESNEYSKVMLDASPVGAMIWDENFQAIDCNTSMAKTFGLKKERSAFMENLHKLFPEFQPDGVPSVQKMQEQLLKAFDEGYASSPWMGTSIDGKEVPTEATAVRTKHNGKNMVVVFYQDLREVEKNIKKAQAAEKRSEAILNGVPMGINIINSNLQIVDCNEAAIRIAKFTSKEDLLANAMQSFPEFQPSGQSSALMIQEKFAEVMEKGKSRFEILALDATQELYFMDITLSRAYIENEDLYIAYCADLRETKKMIQEVELSRELAEKSALAKSEFLANMSHEIRTPMNGILGLLRILSSTNLDKKQQDYTQKALFSTNELLRIINDILDFSKIEAGKLEMESTPFTIHDICCELENFFGHTIKNKRLHCSMLEGDFSTQVILGDPLRLKQVLVNLINNAIKFTEQGTITLEVQNTIEENLLQCQFKVSDTGIGLSDEQIGNLFSAFTQADTSVTRKYGGTGLGLAICKNIVEMMHGRIWVESTLGEGSSFFFTAYFPLADAGVTPSPCLDAEQEKTPCSGHILLVEDNQINQIIAEELLQSFGYTLDIANNGQEALDMLEENSYDIILMDIQMPIMDGLSATKAIRQQERFAALPIVAMSAHAMTGDKEKSLEHGMNDHITKPISPDILYTTLCHWIPQKKQEQCTA